jgi:hypothetical protein
MSHAMASSAARQSWLNMLDQIEADVAGALTQLEQCTSESAPPASLEVESTAQRVRIDEWMRGLESRLGMARELVAGAQSLLDEDQRFVNAWQQSIAEARQRPGPPQRLS